MVNTQQTKTQDLIVNKKKRGLQKLEFTRRRERRPFVLDVLFDILKLILLAVLILCFVGGGFIYGVGKAYIDTVPTLDVEQLTKSDRTTYIYDMYGNEITNMTTIEYRDWVNIEDVPTMLKNAFIAVEDVRFYKHQGVDFKRLFSAALEILGNSNSSGGSTLTQQLIKNKILGSERTYKRKIQEAYLALQLETTVSKDEILEAYLNDIYLGGSNYGIVTAAKDYFGKELSELTIRECAMLAGLTQNPYRYNPRLNKYYRDEDSYQTTVDRTDTVLERMYANGYITKQQYQSALAEDVYILEESQNSKMYDMAYFVEYAIYDVITCWMKQDGVSDTTANRTSYENKLRSGGYKIYTTVDQTVQNTVQTALADWQDYPQLANSSASVVTEVISDSVTIETVEPQAAAVVIDQTTGELRAIVGGRNEPAIRKGLNRAYQSYLEVGSSIKPLSIYGPALEMGLSPASIIPNVAWTIEGWGGENGYPSGGLSDKQYGPVTLRTGLVKSLNVVAARLLLEYISIDASVEYLKKLGIEESQLNKDGAGLALGTSGITCVQMAAAYAAIANNGYYNTPTSFTKVLDENGNVVLDSELIRGPATQVYNKPSTPYLLVDMMKNAVESGTGTKAQIDGYQVAGKTGTNSDYSSVYFAGMTCKYTAVLWIGHDQPANKLTSGSDGGTYAAPLWQNFMSKIMEGEESKDIINASAESLGLVSRTVCPVSGLLATDSCVNYYYYMDKASKFKVVTDLFTYDSVPTDSCDMHVTLNICTKSNCIASDSCASESIKSVTYVLIRPSSPFYTMSDEVLNKVFGDTWRRTDKSISDFTAEFPVCVQCAAESTPPPEETPAP